MPFLMIGETYEDFLDFVLLQLLKLKNLLHPTYVHIDSAI